jgi:hypothetical protein
MVVSTLFDEPSCVIHRLLRQNVFGVLFSWDHQHIVQPHPLVTCLLRKYTIHNNKYSLSLHLNPFHAKQYGYIPCDILDWGGLHYFDMFLFWTSQDRLTIILLLEGTNTASHCCTKQGCTQDRGGGGGQQPKKIRPCFLNCVCGYYNM